jgi:hypothetical protein
MFLISVFIPILFSLPIFINFHDSLTLNYTKLYLEVPCGRIKTITFWDNLIEKRDREDEMKIRKFYYVYRTIWTAIRCNLRLDYHENLRR